MTISEAKELMTWARENGVLEMQFDGLTFSLHPNSLKPDQTVIGPDLDSIEATDESDIQTFRGIPKRDLVGALSG